MTPMPIRVVIGVSGSGKTTVGAKLAHALDCAFLEGDDLHPRSNVEKMSHGIPLTDADRAPWLAVIHTRMQDAFTRGQCLVVACSALKRTYRTVLAQGLPVTWIYLKGSADLIRSRLQHRARHFMKATMLASQFETLEEPEPTDAIVVDISPLPDTIVEHILTALRGSAHVPTSTSLQHHGET